MDLHYPSGGQAGEPPQRPAPAPVRNAVKLMYAGAAVSTITVMISLVIAIADVKAAARGRWLGYSLTAARLSHLQPLIVTLVVVLGLAVIALWLWMARANRQGRSWARILATVLAGLAVLELTTNHGLEQVFWALSCLVGLGAVWLLWRPAASAFFIAARPHV